MILILLGLQYDTLGVRTMHKFEFLRKISKIGVFF